MLPAGVGLAVPHVKPQPPSSDVPSVDSLVIVKCLRKFIFYFIYFLQGDAHVEKDTKQGQNLMAFHRVGTAYNCL